MSLEKVKLFIEQQKKFSHMQFAHLDVDLDQSKDDLFKWIVEQSNWPTLKIHVDIPLKDIQEEVLNCDKYWVEHRTEDSDGWESMCIHGQAVDFTGGYNEEQGEYGWTELTEVCPRTTEWLQDSWGPNSIGFKDFKRVRFMKLKPNGYIMPHQDFQQRKLSAFNISITEPVGHEFAQEQAGLVPWEEGDVRLMDIGRLHSLYNSGTEDRVHIIVHGTYNAITVNSIIKSFKIEQNKFINA
ncbi:aspartyl/asparaginyl beta-hydroxylase domain-containing protein [bacterium]|nr:aspartyl/asparaginyl beta-hydroxylase domain-containing protein [bacterium]